MVILTHIEQMKMFKKLDYNPNLYPFHTGTLGVTIFFVLSGFLITYLLLSEEQTFKRIDVGKFYVRRMLRIWPLYYLIVILALFILPHFEIFILPDYGEETFKQSFYLKVILYFLFLPNLVLSLFGVVPFVSPTWSVGTEEQFYLIWPWFFKLFKKYRVWALLLLIFGYHLFSYLLYLGYLNFIPYKYLVIAFIKTFNIDYMAIGGIFAILFFDKSKLLKFVINNYTFYLSLIIALLMWINNINIPYFHFQTYSLLFAVIIINFSTNENLHISLENKTIQYLGKISYGLYIYHSIAIVLAISLTKELHLVSDWLIYPLSFLFSILIAGISYAYFEKYFLKFKFKFSNIISG